VVRKTEQVAPGYGDETWDDSAAARRPVLRDALRGAGLALAAGMLISVAGIGTVVVLLVASLGPSHRSGPGDGRHSRGIPISVTPTVGLQDGTPVSVRASRLAGARQAIVALCGAEAQRSGKGVAACDLGHRNQVPVHRGKVDTEFSVSQSIIRRGGRQLDCGTRLGRCVLMVASAENYDRSGFVPLTFLPGQR